MRSSRRLYTIEEVASLTYKSVSITKACAAKLGLGKKYPKRGRSFLYTQDDALRILAYMQSISRPTKRKVATMKVGKRKPVIASKRKTTKAE